jgi:hypothetical protein
MQTHYCWNLDDQHCRTTDRGVIRRDNGLRPSGEHQHDCSTFAHQLERLKGGVEEKNSTHDRLAPYRLKQRPPCCLHHGHWGKRVRGAAIGHHSKIPVVSIRQGQVRGVTPPPAGSKTPTNAHQHQRVRRVSREMRTQPTGPVRTHVVAPRHPTSAAPRIGPSLPSPDGSNCRSAEYSMHAIVRAASLAMAKNSSPNPRATDPAM